MNSLDEFPSPLALCNGRMLVFDAQAEGDTVPLDMLPLKTVDRKRAVCLQKKERSPVNYNLSDSRWFGVSV